MAKKYDLAVKTGSYTDRDGKTKNRYENVGAVMEGQDGPYIMLKKTFNPAGVAGKEGSDAIVVSMFTPRDNAGQSQPPASQQPLRQQLSDDIPF